MRSAPTAPSRPAWSPTVDAASSWSAVATPSCRTRSRPQGPAVATTPASRPWPSLTARASTPQRRRKVRLSYDTSLFTGPRVNPHWPKTYLPDVVSPITALWADEGLDPDGYGRVPDPPATAADLFAAYLRKRGIDVASTITQQKAAGMPTSWPA